MRDMFSLTCRLQVGQELVQRLRIMKTSGPNIPSGLVVRP